MKIKKEDIPVTTQSENSIMRALPGYGGMTVAFSEMPAETDITPLLQGLENNSCHCHIGDIWLRGQYGLSMMTELMKLSLQVMFFTYHLDIRR